MANDDFAEILQINKEDNDVIYSICKNILSVLFEYEIDDMDERLIYENQEELNNKFDSSEMKVMKKIIIKIEKRKTLQSKFVPLKKILMIF